MKTESHSLNGRHVTRIRLEKASVGDWHDGDVVTPHGIVSVMAQGDEINHHYTRWDFAHKGRLYMRTIHKRFSPRGIVREAKKFAKEISSTYPTSLSLPFKRRTT